ncbi:MAG: hypothetical protein GTN70_01220 [Deltaproteobacteria bacterium]|nr:hypothetical protein [Deltaproteobacteria bacterium]NIS76272.1 hypothetical protein [Deltaproteobacteria bacterium]
MVETDCGLGFSRPAEDTMMIRFLGTWKLGSTIPAASEVEKQVSSGPLVKKVTFETEELTAWDSALITFLLKIFSQFSDRKVEVVRDGLPDGVNRLLDLATAVPERAGARKEAVKVHVLARIGGSAVEFWRSTIEFTAFIGSASLAFMRFLTGRARFRRSDLALVILETGALAFPIVSLISILVGLILAFVGAIQLKMFGAQLYVANLVGIAMVREMAAIMTGIIMAGRTGAAFAAQLGTMQVNEEIDALETMGIDPMEFLVLPRMLGLTLMMPLLCLYANLMGILGGLIVGVGMLDIGLLQYYNQTRLAISMNDFWIGLFMGLVFGVLVSLAGCLRGIQCGRSASDVGRATTSAVVTGIVSIIVATAIITVICDVIGI